MKVSVCITIYNEEQNIEALLNSLVNQSKIPDEIVVVDGGSTDKTVENINKFKSKYKNLRTIVKKCSRAEGRNISIEKARYDVIAMTDAGCTVKADWLEKITRPFEECKTEVVAGFYNMLGDKPIQKASSIFLGILPEDFSDEFLPSTRSIAFLKDTWKKVGGFPENLEDTAEDTIFNYKLIKSNVKIKRVKDARVEWSIPSSLKVVAQKMYSYAKGDAKSGVVIFPSKGITSHNIKVIFKLFRYILIFPLFVLGLIYDPLFIFILSVLLFLYSFYSFSKVFRKTKHFSDGLWGIVLQYISDLTGIWGFVEGNIDNFKKNLKTPCSDKSRNLLFKLQMYFKYIHQFLKAMFYLKKGQNVIYCIGDSHMMIFEDIEKSKKFKRTHFFIFAIGGATAMGMGNPLSKTQAYKRFKRFLKLINRKSTILLGLGEVDCGFVVWYRREKYKTSVQEQLEYALKRYQKFLEEVKNMGYKNVIVLSAQPSTIMDGRNKGKVSNLRVGITASLQQRSNLTMKFNENMKKFCENINVKYLDLFSEVVGKNGIVEKKYLNDNVYNHHLNTRETLPIFIKLLNAIGFE